MQCKSTITIDRVVACILARKECKFQSEQREIHTKERTQGGNYRIYKYYKCNKQYNEGLKY